MADTPALTIPAGTTSGSILDQGDGVSTAPVTLDDLVHTTPINAATPPIGAVRNQAAKVALLSGDPDNATQNYQLMLNEANQGSNVTLKNMTDKITSDVQKQDYSSTMNVLSDPAIPFEQKQAVIQNFNKNAALKDTGMTVQTNLLQAPSKGESVDGGNARLSVADAFNEMYSARSQVQGMVNSLKKEDEEAPPLTQFLNAASGLVPYVNSVMKDKVFSQVAKDTGIDTNWLSHFVNDFQSGIPVARLRDQFESLPPQQQIAFGKSLMDSVKAKSGFIFGTDNQHSAYELMADVVNTGSYGNGSQFIDSTFSLLDALGAGGVAHAGAGIVKAGGKLLKSAITGGEDVAAAAGRSEPFIGQEAGSGMNPGAAEPTMAKYGATDVPFTETPNTAPAATVKQPPLLPDSRPDVLKRVTVNNTVAERNPASPGEIAAQANPEAARAMHQAAFTDTSDATAEAVYGTSRQDALASNIMPQAATDSGVVATRVADMDKNLRQQFLPDSQMIGIIHDAGGEELTKAELATARANVVNDFGNAEGLRMNTGMSSFSSDGRYTNVSAVYETDGGSFANAQQAVDQTKYALRGQGVLDSDITLLRKQGLDHVPVSLDEARGVDGDYKVQVNMNRPVDYRDLGDRGMDAMTVRLNAADRFSPLTSNGRGSVANHMIDAASQLDRVYTGAGAVVDYQTNRLAKRLLEKAGEFSDRYVATVASRGQTAAERKAGIDAYIREANYNEIPFDVNDLQARGFTHNEIQTLTKFREFWDNHYHLENMDLVGSMDRQGYQMFKNATTELHARPVAKNRTLGSMYDPSTDSVRAFTDAEIDHIYNTGGTIAKFRSPIDFAGQSAEHMVSRNTPDEYLRKLRDTDKLLNYRDGYFQLQYKAPKFVDLVERGDNNSVVSRKTVAVAGDTKEAQAFADRMNLNNPGKGTHEVRNDDRALTRDRAEAWDIDQASGRISQRHRGKLLEDGSGLNRLGDGSYIINPSEAALKASRSIAGRTISRPMLDTAKERFVQQYGEFLRNEQGHVSFPNSLEEIGAKGDQTSSKIADARSTFMYIHNLETGYINTMDQVTKALLHSVADGFGNRGMSAAERTVRGAASGSLTHQIKGTVFGAYIATNIPRQLIIQPYQAVRTLGYNPIGWLNGKVPTHFMDYVNYALKGKPANYNSDFVSFMKRTGILDAIDQNNLVRGTLMQATEAGKGSIPSRVVQGMRKLGFDLGESANQIGHAAAVYDRFERLGYDMKAKETVSAVSKEVNALTYGLTRANDMPYNSGSMAGVLQFMQIPHKALLNYINRQFDAMTSARMLATDLILFGAPTGMIGSFLGKDVLPDNADVREFMQHGVLTLMYNHILNSMFEGYKGIDFSSLDPRGMDGWQKMYLAVAGGGGASGILAASPLGSLVGNRFGNAINTMARYFTPLKHYDDNDPTTFTNVVSEVAKISSLWNNVSKAKLMMEFGRRVDQYGHVIDEKTTSAETIAQMFGFGSYSQKNIYDLSTGLSKDSKAYKDNVLKEYQDIKKYCYQQFSAGDVDPHFMTCVTGAALNHYKTDPDAQQIITKQMQFDMTGADQSLLKSIVQAAGLPNRGNLLDKIHSLPPAMQQYVPQLEQVVRDTDNAKQYLKDKEAK